MKRILPKSIDILIDKLSQLPGIGPKSASRLAFVLLNRSDASIADLSNAIVSLKQNLHNCPRCFLITDAENECVICQDASRNQFLVCVVESSLDVVALESSGSFKGMYHILGGVISPLEGVGPEQLHIDQLVKRVSSEPFQEVIIATNPSLEGEATAFYISNRLKGGRLKITRIARGLPIGGSFEYADTITITRSLEGRQNVESVKEE